MVINPQRRLVVLGKERRKLPKTVEIVVNTAREVNREDAGVIRFYPEGGSSGGGLDIERPGVGGVAIKVDWLLGSVSHEAYDFD